MDIKPVMIGGDTNATGHDFDGPHTEVTGNEFNCKDTDVG